MSLVDRITSACQRLRDLTGPETNQEQCGSQIVAALLDLERITMTTELLRTTKAGKIVNSVRNKLENRALKDRAKKLITIWKAVVAKPTAETSQTTQIKRESLSVKEPLPTTGRVSSLQTLCLTVLRHNIARLGRLDGIIPTPILLQIAQNAKASDLMRLEKLNPEIISDLDTCWKRVARLDLPEQYAAVEDAENMPASFWREFYKNVLQDREKKTQEYAARLAEKNKLAENVKLQTSVKRLKPEASIVKKTIIRARDEPVAKVARTAAVTSAKGNGRLAKILEPAKKRLKMEKRFRR